MDYFGLSRLENSDSDSAQATKERLLLEQALAYRSEGLAAAAAPPPAIRLWPVASGAPWCRRHFRGQAALRARR